MAPIGRSAGYTFLVAGREERGMSRENKKQSYWERVLSIDDHAAGEERVVEYITHRLGEGAS